MMMATLRLLFAVALVVLLPPAVRAQTGPGDLAAAKYIGKPIVEVRLVSGGTAH